MKRILFILSLSIMTYANAQKNFYYGLPSKDNKLFAEDIITINLPRAYDTDFLLSSFDMKSLILFLNDNSEWSFIININIFINDSSFSKDYSKLLAKNLNNIFRENLNDVKYIINACGNDRPLIFDKKNIFYRLINTRIEILIHEIKEY